MNLAQTMAQVTCPLTRPGPLARPPVNPLKFAPRAPAWTGASKRAKRASSLAMAPIPRAYADSTPSHQKVLNRSDTKAALSVVSNRTKWYGVVRRLVAGRKNNGRAVYDPKAKTEVVRACMKPGVSVARMALQCGINANLLRRWITQSMGADIKASRSNMPTVATADSDAFVPLRFAAPGTVPVPVPAAAAAGAAAALKLPCFGSSGAT